MGSTSREPHVEGAGDPGDRAAEGVDVAGVGEQVTVGHRDPVDEAAPDELGRQATRLVGDHPDAVRPVVHQVAQGPIVAGGGQAALGDHEHVRSESGHLVEHVTRHEQALAGRPELVEEADHAVALHRVETRQRFVEHEQVGIVDERRRQLDALAHALRVGTDRLRFVGVERDLVERPRRRPARVVDGVGAGRDLDEATCREPVEQPVLLRRQPDPPAHRGVGAGVGPEHAHRALGGGREAAHHPEQRRLAGPVRPEQGGDARADGERHVRDGDHVTERLGHVGDLDHRRLGSRRGGGWGPLGHHTAAILR